MGYCTKEDVQFYGQFSEDFAIGYDAEASYQKAIDDASRRIDGYCNVPEGFFVPGGIEIQHEYLNGADVAYIGGVTKFFKWYYGATSHLKFKKHPVLSVTKFEEETGAGGWTSRTEGSNADYVVVSDGVRFVQNVPAWKWKNVRVTYRAGYTTTPSEVVEVCGLLAAKILQEIEDRKNRAKAAIQGETVSWPEPQDPFSDDLKLRLQKFKLVIYAFG